MVRRFCQALVDYAATAHFQLYRYIVENKERRQAVLDGLAVEDGSPPDAA